MAHVSGKVSGTGTVTKARMKAIPLPNRKDVEKQWDRGQYEVIYHKDIVAVVWKDNKGVCVLSNIHEVEPPHQVKRWSKQEHKYTHVTMPALIDDYNSNMGGVDMIDKMVGAYRIRYSIYSTIRYNTVQYDTIQCCTIRYCTILYNTVMYNTVLYSTVQYCNVQYGTV